MTPDAFAALHRPGTPLFLVNAWDLASARYLHAGGRTVVGTTSLGVAYAAGKSDGAGEILDETLRLVTACTRAGIPVSADMEGGFSDDPAEVARNTAELARAGAVGVNIEDGLPNGSLRDTEHAAEIIRAAAGAGIFVNARTDPYWLGLPGAPEDVRNLAHMRAAAYVSAGANGVFVPGVTEGESIRWLAGHLAAPLNVLAQPGGPGLTELAALGVARVSTGSLLFRQSMGAIRAGAEAAENGIPQAGPGPVPAYAELT